MAGDGADRARGSSGTATAGAPQRPRADGGGIRPGRPMTSRVRSPSFAIPKMRSPSFMQKDREENAEDAKNSPWGVEQSQQKPNPQVVAEKHIQNRITRKISIAAPSSPASRVGKEATGGLIASPSRRSGLRRSKSSACWTESKSTGQANPASKSHAQVEQTDAGDFGEGKAHISCKRSSSIAKANKKEAVQSDCVEDGEEVEVIDDLDTYLEDKKTIPYPGHQDEENRRNESTDELSNQPSNAQEGSKLGNTHLRKGEDSGKSQRHSKAEKKQAVQKKKSRGQERRSEERSAKTNGKENRGNDPRKPNREKSRNIEDVRGEGKLAEKVCVRTSTGETKVPGDVNSALAPANTAENIQKEKNVENVKIKAADSDGTHGKVGRKWSKTDAATAKKKGVTIADTKTENDTGHVKRAHQKKTGFSGFLAKFKTEIAAKPNEDSSFGDAGSEAAKGMTRSKSLFGNVKLKPQLSTTQDKTYEECDENETDEEGSDAEGPSDRQTIPVPTMAQDDFINYQTREKGHHWRRSKA